MSGTYTKNDARRKMLERVRSLLAKTMANGCTEGEAMAALGKARELMAAYEFTESDLQPETEKAQILSTGWDDPYRIKWYLSSAVGKFARCRPWRSSTDGVTFCGLESDVAFAMWLLGTLQAFVLREVKDYRECLLRDGRRAPRILSSSFVHGATGRISDRLRELTPAEPTGTGLVLSRRALIDATMSAAGITLRKVRSSRIPIDPDAFDAGEAAGNAASFAKPIGAGGPLRLMSGLRKRA
jgi:Protein of unknown function (DUF2786)